MTLLKSRPKIRLKVPNEIRAGTELYAIVELTCRRPVDVEHVRIRLEGKETCYANGPPAGVRAVEFLRMGATLAEHRTLPEGRTSLPVRIPLPEGVPPSYRGTSVRVEYEAHVHVGIDWWPDARGIFELKVVPPPVASPPTEPRIFSSDPDGPRGSEPHVELSLSSTWTRVGDLVTGAFALSNVAQNRYSSVRVGLRALEGVRRSPHDRHLMDQVSYEIRLPAATVQEGEMVPFSFRLPADAMCEYESTVRPVASRPTASSLSWVLDLAVSTAFRSDLVLRVPFRVLPASKDGEAPLRLAPPAVGSDRLRAIWEQVGAPLGLRYEAQTLRGSFGETGLVVRRDHQGQDGVYLVAALRYPDIGLDLTVEPASALRKLVGGGVRTGDAKWDGDHYAVARDEEQAAIVLRKLIRPLRSAQLRWLDDHTLAVAVRDTGASRASLERFVSGAAGLAKYFEEQVRTCLPPPTKMQGVLEEWRSLERTLNARLEPARMRIAGQLGEHAAEVRLELDAQGEPLHTGLAVKPSTPIDAGRQLRWMIDDGPASDAIAPRFTGELGERLAVICDGARELLVEPELIALCLPAPLGLAREDGAIVSVAFAERRLERMAQLATLLRANAGPYR